ncbi:putative ADH3-alcohol dehydrogenase III [Fusarium austroafricanum]|uniref:Putative ADH3-alcohol dehydrogenase III n=1 Tax=Fusarium austroafricanum TaxID=2364996 RepID=A0A8H4KN23_9HYPO|nr:putative ADH3-alcohol dehydrogenase III [Fusarium austroafricanum]
MSIPKQHKAVIYDKPGFISTKVVSVDTPDPGAGEVLINLTHSGVCHSDYAVMTNGWKVLPAPINVGQVGGHEGVGHVVKLGPGVESVGIKVGDRVGVKWVASACGRCDACLVQSDGVCFNAKISGYYTPGTFQQYVVGPAAYVTPIPDGLDAATAAPLLCAGLTAYSALLRSQAKPGSWVVVSGAGGGLGHLACQLGSRALGLRIIGIDHPSKADLVKECGAEHFIDMTQFKQDSELTQHVKSLSDGLGAHAVIVCAASNRAYAQSVGLLRVGGRVVCVGVPEGDIAPVGGADPPTLITRQQSVVGSATGNQREAIEVLGFAARGIVKAHVDIKKMDQLTQVFEDMHAGPLLIGNIVNTKAADWFERAGGPNFYRDIRAPYHIPQIYNPLEWISELGLRRPADWSAKNAAYLAFFNHLYRVRHRYSNDPSWHHWIYLSAQQQPLNKTWNVDPWDQGFLDLLQHRDRHEPMGRANFHYMSCHNSFLCEIWRVDAPALLHFTNEPLKLDMFRAKSRKLILDPVSVRVFEFPLGEPIIPGIFPSYVEQMKAITASNSSFWATKKPYSNFDQTRGQANKVLKKIEIAHPWSYGALVKLETKWTELWAADETVMIHGARLISFAAGALPTYYGSRAWERLSRWRKEREQAKSPQPAANSAERDILTSYLQFFVDSMSEEEKEKYGKTEEGGRILRNVRSALESKDWDTPDVVMDDIGRAMRIKKNRKL